MARRLRRGCLGVSRLAPFVPFFGSSFIFIFAANFFGLIPAWSRRPPTPISRSRSAVDLFRFLSLPGLQHRRALVISRSFLAPCGGWRGYSGDRGRGQSLSAVFAGRSSFRQYVRRSQVTGCSRAYTNLVIPLAFYALGSFVCVVQALVFMILSVTYVRMASAGH